MNQSTGCLFALWNPERQVHYYAVSALDEGGFGTVWDGFTSYGLHVAIKIIKPTGDIATDFRAWYTEQQIYLLSLHHPHIITTIDQFISSDGSLFIVMERAGGSLYSLVQDIGPIDPWAVCSIGTQVALALHHVHGLSAIHRDVTLHNILWFANGSVKLADFGISRQLLTVDEIARTFIGRKGSVPPELYTQGYSTVQSDIYQLGLVLLALLSGQPPIPYDASPEDILSLIVEARPRLLAEALTAQYGKLAEIISIMLRRRHQWRYQTAIEVWWELYQEAERRKRLNELAQWTAQQAKPQVPSWLRQS